MRNRFLTTLIVLLVAGMVRGQVPTGQPVPVGLNIDVNEQALVDMINPQTRLDTTASSDANGWPQGDFTFIVDNRYTFAWFPNATNIDPLKRSTEIGGTYKLSFRGQATLGGFGITVTNKQYNAATNTTTADITVPTLAQSPGGVIVGLQFTNTRRLASDTSNTGITDAHLIRPNFATTNPPLFTDLFLNSLKNERWSAFRCMGVLGTNDYGADNTAEAYPYQLAWATDRALPTVGPLYQNLHPGVHGIPWEYVVRIAQETRRDLWINIPVNASQDYIRQVAQLLKNGNAFTGNAGIPTDINLYVEYSNEMWHPGFPQGPWNQRAAYDEAKAGNSNLTFDGKNPDNNFEMEYIRLRRIAKKTVEIGQTFRQVFLENPARIRPVINNAGYFMVYYPDMLNYVATQYGPPNQFLYGISQTAYYGSSDKSSVDAILAGERTASNTNAFSIANTGGDPSLPTAIGYIPSRTLTTFYGLRSLIYEGGQAEEGNKTPGDPFGELDTTLPNLFAAARDPRMADVEMHDLHTNWFPAGGDLYMQFSHVGRYSTYGMWGLTEDLTNLNTGKWLGMVQAMATPAPTVTAGWAIPSPGSATFPASSTYGNQSTTGIEMDARTGDYWTLNYLLNVGKTGNYTVRLRVNNSSGTGQAQIQVNGTSVGTVTLPAAGGNNTLSTTVPLTLTQGLNTLRVVVNKGTTGGNTTDRWRLNALTFDAIAPTGPVDVTGLLTIQISDLLRDPVTQLYYHDVTLINNTAQTINGPIHVLAVGLPRTIGFVNASGTLNGSQCRTENISLAPKGVGGDRATIRLWFKKPNTRAMPVTYQIAVFAGNL